MASKKLITKSIDPQSAIRMFIIESNMLEQNSSKIKRHENIIEQYKSLSKDQKYYIAEFTTDTIYSKYLNIFGEGKYIDSKYYLENKNENKELFIIEEKIANIENLLSISSMLVLFSTFFVLKFWSNPIESFCKGHFKFVFLEFGISVK